MRKKHSYLSDQECGDEKNKNTNTRNVKAKRWRKIFIRAKILISIKK